MTIPFTQYLLPDGRTRAVKIARPEHIERMAARFIASGGRYEAEMLRTGAVSFTAVREVDGEPQDVAIEVCDNGPEVLNAVDAVVMRSLDFVPCGKEGKQGGS